MKVLLSGASGFIGQYVLKALQQRGIDVVAVSRSQPQTAVSFIKADLLSIGDFASLVQQVRASHLLHLAWYTEHGKYWTSALNLRWVEATTRLVEAFCAAGGQQVVVAGTCAEYDWQYGYCREDTTALNPATLYGVTKDVTRRLLMAMCAQYGVRFAWGRIFLPYGKGESIARLIPALIEVFCKKRPPFGVNVQAYRDFLHASDVAEAFIRLIIEGANGVYNISSGEPTRLADLVIKVASLLGTDPQAVLALPAERTGEPPLLVGENLKLKALGWRPALTLAQGLELCIQGGMN
ncbi:NAD-dependent epimerase/dehydratase family protein [Parathermosynechococcus lividus]|nr:NAD(P)-dependent oxidoreductase [Synechococcus sp. PCC 6716]